MINISNRIYLSDEQSDGPRTSFNQIFEEVFEWHKHVFSFYLVIWNQMLFRICLFKATDTWNTGFEELVQSRGPFVWMRMRKDDYHEVSPLFSHSSENRGRKKKAKLFRKCCSCCCFSITFGEGSPDNLILISFPFTSWHKTHCTKKTWGKTAAATAGFHFHATLWEWVSEREFSGDNTNYTTSRKKSKESTGNT